MRSTRLYIQNHGSLRTDVRWLVEGDDFASVPGLTDDDHCFDCPTTTLVVDHPDGLFLVDTSCPRHWRQRWGGGGPVAESPYSVDRDDQFFDVAVARLGYRLSDFDGVIFTHLHFDHAGNAQLFRDLAVPLIVHRDEVAAYMAIEGEFVDGYLAGDLEGIAEERFQAVTGDTELVPGLTLLELPGHSAGTMGVMVDLARTGQVVYTGDAAHLQMSYREEHRSDPGAWSVEVWHRSIQRLRAIEGQGARILCSHDPQQLTGGWALAPAHHD